MNKRKRAMLLAAVLAGALLTGCGEEAPQPQTTTVAAPQELKTNIFPVEEAFESIRVEAKVSAVRLLPTPGGCTVGCTEVSGLGCSVAVEGDTLVIREEGNAPADSGAEILVCLPTPDHRALEITTAGHVDVPPDFSFTDVTCRTEAGELRIGCLAAGDMILETGSGDVIVDHCDGETITIKTDTGNVTGTVRSDKTFTVEAGGGTVRVPDTTGGDCRITTNGGNVELRIGGT